MNAGHDSSQLSLAQLNVRLPRTDQEALKLLARDNGVSVNALLGAILEAFLSDHIDEVPTDLLTHARRIDSARRSRPHLRRASLATPNI